MGVDRTHVGVARGLCLTIVLAGAVACSSGDGPGTLPPLPSTSATSTTTPTFSVPPFPATKDGAAAFVRLYLQAARRAQTSGDTAQLRELITTDCTNCLRYAESMEQLWSTGRVEGGVLTARFVEVSSADARQAVVTVIGDVSAARLLSPDGEVVRRIPAGHDVVFVYHLTRSADAWRVNDYEAAR